MKIILLTSLLLLNLFSMTIDEYMMDTSHIDKIDTNLNINFGNKKPKSDLEKKVIKLEEENQLRKRLEAAMLEKQILDNSEKKNDSPLHKLKNFF